MGGDGKGRGGEGKGKGGKGRGEKGRGGRGKGKGVGGKGGEAKQVAQLLLRKLVLPVISRPGVSAQCGANWDSQFPVGNSQGILKVSVMSKMFVKLLTKYDTIHLICVCNLYHKNPQTYRLICTHYKGLPDRPTYLTTVAYSVQ